MSKIIPDLQCFDAVGWVARRASGLQKTEWWDAGMVICLGRDTDLHMPSWCHSHLLSLALVNPDWFYFPVFTFLVPAHPGSPGHSPGAVKQLCCRFTWKPKFVRKSTRAISI